jgi:regulator of protease activity HflC (stomatin/prohibitin superfamily)
VAITRDNVTVNVDSVLYWHVVDPYISAYQVDNICTAVIERTMTTLRQVIGSHDLQDAITNRESIGNEIEVIAVVIGRLISLL